MSFNDSNYVDLPEWAHCLYSPYWRIRIEGRNKSLKRQCYRKVEKLKLQLVESGQDQELVEAICKYMATLKNSSGCVQAKIVKS